MNSAIIFYSGYKNLVILFALPLLVSCLHPKTKSEVKDKTINFDTLSINDVKNVGDKLVRHRVTIQNISSRDLAFQFKISGGKFENYQLASQQQWVSPYSEDNPQFSLKNGKKITTVKLELGKKYKLFFNQQKKVWDIKSDNF